MTILKIQPGPGDTYDSFVDEDNPNANYKDAVTLIVGGDIPHRRQSLVQFDLSGIPAGATITKAEFAVYCLIADGDPDVKCHEVSQAWYLDTVDWNERPIPGMPGIAGVLSQGNWTKFDVRAIVLDWLENPEYNLGFQIIAQLCVDSYNTLASGDYLDDVSFRPYLEITYSGGVGVGYATIKTGTYEGDGAAQQSITGVGGQPKFVFIWRQATDGWMFAKTDQDGVNALLWNATNMKNYWTNDFIISLDVDGFTVGDGTGLANVANIDGAIYTYLALW